MVAGFLCAHIGTVELVQKVLHVFNGQAREVVDLQLDDLGEVANKLKAVLGMHLQMISVILSILRLRKFLLQFIH